MLARVPASDIKISVPLLLLTLSRRQISPYRSRRPLASASSVAVVYPKSWSHASRLGAGCGCVKTLIGARLREGPPLPSPHAHRPLNRAAPRKGPGEPLTAFQLRNKRASPRRSDRQTAGQLARVSISFKSDSTKTLPYQGLEVLFSLCYDLRSEASNSWRVSPLPSITI